MKGQISSNPAVLDTLHQTYTWIPSSSQIRPDAVTTDRKKLYLQTQTVEDVIKDICTIVFGSECIPEDKCHAICDSSFPYDTDGRHRICWMVSSSSIKWTDLEINNVIFDFCRMNSVQEFVWYRNPKMTIVDERLDHVHIFHPR